MTHRLLRYGDQAWLVDCAGDPVVVADALRRWDWQDPPELVVGATTCMLRFDHTTPPADQVRAALRGAEPGDEPRSAGHLMIPVRYDGADLGEVAERSGLTVAAVIAQHRDADYRVAFLGFSPGFAYLSGLPPDLQLPRRSVPRVRVPAGSLAIADRYTAVYPRSSPGGWHLIGSTDVTMFDADRDPPSLLQPGTVVRFREA